MSLGSNRSFLLTCSNGSNGLFHLFFRVAECNNALIYPGIGFGTLPSPFLSRLTSHPVLAPFMSSGAIVSRSRSITKGMIVAATHALAQLSPALKDPDAALLPDFMDSRDVNLEVAYAVVKKALEEGVADVEWGKTEDKGQQVSEEMIREKVKEKMWIPAYREYVFDAKGET